MKYKVRPGIILTEICGTYLLIPTREASEYCPSVIRISPLMVGIWKTIADDKPVENVYKVMQILTKKPDDEVKEFVDAKLDDLYEKGLLILREESQ